jgi:hypothetical protein
MARARVRSTEVAARLAMEFPDERASPTTAGVLATCWAELEHRVGYSHVMDWFDPTKAHAVPRSVALRDQVYAPQGVTGESIRVVGG